MMLDKSERFREREGRSEDVPSMLSRTESPTRRPVSIWLDIGIINKQQPGSLQRYLQQGSTLLIGVAKGSQQEHLPDFNNTTFHCTWQPVTPCQNKPLLMTWVARGQIEHDTGYDIRNGCQPSSWLCAWQWIKNAVCVARSSNFRGGGSTADTRY